MAKPPPAAPAAPSEPHPSDPTVTEGVHKVTLQEMSDHVSSAAKSMPEIEAIALYRAALVVQTEAKRVIGTYDYGWPRLQPETIARKGGDTPLLETGEMRDSIEISVSADGHTASVGSNNPKAVWHELGTVHIPARSFLMGAALRTEQEVHEIVGKSVFAGLMSGSPFGLGIELSDIPRRE